MGEITGFRTLRNLPPEFFSELREVTIIQTLSITQSRITVIPPYLEWLSASLKHLDLSNNAIKRVWPDLAKMTALETLDLSGNRITYVPDLRPMEALTSLVLSGNENLD